MIILPISLTIAAGAALLNLWLSVRVGRVRTREKVFVGDGGNEAVTRRMRAHSNFVENTAFVLILLALVELGIGPSIWLWAAGALYLVGRKAERLESMAADLKVRGAARIETQVMDACDRAQHEAMLTVADTFLCGLDVALIAHGSLPDQRACELSVEQTMAEIDTNALSVIALSTLIANRLAWQEKGALAVISSVAGDRGRQSNYVYGAAKGMVSLFLQGLRNRMFKHGVQVLTVKPGFVDTPMTSGFDKGPLWASAEQVARGIVRAIDTRRDVVYLPGFWWPIMWIIRHLPEGYFKKLKL